MGVKTMKDAQFRVSHGINCNKSPHTTVDSHPAWDDGPFKSGDKTFCGRCHHEIKSRSRVTKVELITK